MSEVPERCTTCGTPIPPGESRCRACGKIYGDDNLCPLCHATAGVVARGGGFACAACGGPRERKPGTVILGPTGGPGVGPSSVVIRRGASAGLRTVGAVSIGAGVLAAMLSMIVIGGAAGLALALLLGGVGVGLGALSLRAGAGQALVADREQRVVRERALMDLAEKSDGDLTATEAARALHLSVEEADRSLTELADGARVTVELDPDGLVHYVFRELSARGTAGRVRVAAEPEPEPAELAVPAARERSREEEP